MSYIAGFIGAGNMGGALARAAAKSDCGKIAVADRDNQKASALAGEISADVLSGAEVAASAKYVFLGVKPQMLADLFAEIAPVLKSPRTPPMPLIASMMRLVSRRPTVASPFLFRSFGAL